jgi:signal transduction histidine kinase
MTAQTVAVFGNGEFIPNIRYALKDTPCGKLLDDRVSYYKSGLRQLFPFDAALHEWKAESYFGTTLFDSKGKPIGLIAVLGRHPLKMRKRAEDLLKLISPHAAGELERRHAEEVLLASEAQLHQLNAAKDKFFSIIAHDLKNPFNTIIGFSDILFEQVRSKDYEGIEKYAEIIQQSSHRAMDLLSNLLEWSRSQTGRMIYNPEFVDVVSLIHETVNLLNDSAHQKSITINLKLPAKLPFILDKDMINSVLRNIISNAVKFTFENGMIDISAEQTQDDLLVAVKDNGVGIEQGDIDKLFRIDENSSTPGTQKEMGTGLGLILCKDFIEKHGGRIWVESAMGEGSTFFFQIPAVTYT